MVTKQCILKLRTNYVCLLNAARHHTSLLQLLVRFITLLSPWKLTLCYRIQNASKVLPDTVRMNRTLVRDGNFDFADVQSLISNRRTTPQNRAVLLERLQSALSTGDYGTHFVPCEGTHPWINYCRNVPLDRFVSVFRWMFPIYGALHLVPALLFKRKVFWQDPWKVIIRAALGTTRSSTFLGIFVVIYQSKFKL